MDPLAISVAAMDIISGIDAFCIMAEALVFSMAGVDGVLPPVLTAFTLPGEFSCLPRQDLKISKFMGPFSPNVVQINIADLAATSPDEPRRSGLPPGCALHYNRSVRRTGP